MKLSRFDPDLYNRISSIDKGIKKELFPLSINDMLDLIIEGSYPMKKPEVQRAAKDIIEAKILNIHEFSDFVYRETLRYEGIPIAKEAIKSEDITDEARVIEVVTGNDVFRNDIYNHFSSEPISLKEFNKMYASNTHPLVKRLNDVREHFNKYSSYSDEGIKSLSDYKVDVTVDVFKPKYQRDVLFGMRKRKIPYRAARKKAKMRAENYLLEQEGKEWKPENLNDIGGFLFCGSQGMYVGEKSYDTNPISKIKEFYCSSLIFDVDYDPKNDNYYKNDDRDMEGLQLYIRPQSLDKVLGAGFNPQYWYFPDKTSIDVMNDLVTSVHLQCPRAFLEDRIGVSSHNLYVVRKENKIEEIVKQLPPEKKIEFYETVQTGKKYFIPGWTGDLGTVK
ncbi:MAG: hypothetical protein ACLFSN_02450 [Candidatus Woesearchaeota archaeon]